MYIQLLYASGFLFMGATEEQMVLLSAHHVTHVSYILILYSISFLLFLFTNILLHLYAVHAWPADQDPQRNAPRGYHSSAAAGMAGGGGGSGVGGGAGGSFGRPRILKRHSTGGSVSFVGREGLPFKLVEEDEEEEYDPSPIVAANAPGRKFHGGILNGKVREPRMPRHRQTDSQQIRDAETFELEGLIGKDEGGSDGLTDGETEEEGLLGEIQNRDRDRGRRRDQKENQKRREG